MKKKLLFYIDSMQIGGAQRVMVNLANYFVNNGRDVILVNDIYPSNDVPEYAIDDKIKRLFLETASDNVLKKNLGRILELRTILKKEKPEMVISFLGPPNLRAIIASIGIKMKLTVSVRNDPSKEYGNGIKKLFSKIAFLIPDGCVFQTSEAKEYFFPKTKNKSTIILNPVAEQFFSKKWSPTKKEIVVVGRLEKQKNPYLAITAFMKIADFIPEYKLVFYGDGSLRRQLYTYIKEIDAEDRIELRGRIENVEDVLVNSTLFLMTSDYEGLPNSLMEALAIGIPCVSTDCPCGGPRELMSETNEIQLQQCNDADGIASAILKLVKNDDLKSVCSLIERQISMRFRPKAILSEWEDYIDRI